MAANSKRRSDPRKVTPKNRTAWRTWLSKHHDSHTEIWCVFYKKHTGKPTLSYNDSVEEALCFGWVDGIKRSIDEERYMHRFSPRKGGSKWSASNRARVTRIVAQGLMTDAGMRHVKAAKLSGKWSEAHEGQQTFGMPPELQARLLRNKKAREFFEGLKPGYRKQFITWVAVAKRPETRSRRVEESIELLAKGEKLGMR